MTLGPLKAIDWGTQSIIRLTVLVRRLSHIRSVLLFIDLPTSTERLLNWSKMNTPETTKQSEILRYAETYLRKGKSVIPLDGSLPAIEWKEFRSRLATKEELGRWFEEERNIGIVMGKISGITAVVCDSREEAVWWWESMPRTPVIAKAGTGIQFIYRYAPIGNMAGVLNRKIDVRGDGGYICVFPSVDERGIRHEWIRREGKMPTFDPTWVGTSETVSSGRQRIRDGLARIADIRVVRGENDHTDPLRAAIRLCEFGMSEAEVFAALMEWNRANCDPPLSPREVLLGSQEAHRIVINRVLEQEARMNNCRGGACDIGGRMY